MARAIKLIEAPIGLFEVDGILVLKTEYSTRHEDGTITPDCYITKFGEYFVWSEQCPNCGGTGMVKVTMTNADLIRAMSDEELAKFLYQYFWGREKDMPIAKHRIAEWLQQPVEEDT